MRLEGDSTAALAEVMQAVTSSGRPANLSASDPILVYQGWGSIAVPVTLDQAVTATDRPGSYMIQLVFTAIAGF